MPVGPYETFAECVAAQEAKGESEESASRICGAMENNSEAKVAQEDEEAFDRCVEAQIEKGESRLRARRICSRQLERGREAHRGERALKTQSVETFTNQRGKLFVKAFLLDSSVNLNNWGVTPESIPQHINTFVGKPLVMTENFDHPGTDQDSLPHWLRYQEEFRVGNIIDIQQRKNPQTGSDVYYAIIEVTDKELKASLADNSVPHYVSPAIAQPVVSAAVGDTTDVISEWTGVHLALVDEPAYGVRKAMITETCGGDREGCLLQLMRTASRDFCHKEALKRYRIHVAAYAPRPITLSSLPSSTSQARKSSPTSRNSMSTLETIDSTNDNSKVEKVEESNNNKQPVSIPASSNTPTNIRDLLAENQRLLHELELRDLRDGEKDDAINTMKDRLAALELRDRRKDIERIITPDVIKDDKTRLEKIKSLTSSSIPIKEIEEVYKDLKITIKKASLNQRVNSGKVPYVTSNLSPMNIANTSLTTLTDDDGLTSLQKQLAVLKGGSG